jgi:hypothetical protein
MVVGPPAEAIATVKTITLLLAEVGLTLAATTDSKNVIYGLGTQYTAAQRDLALASDLHWIPSTHGLLVGGTPIGSDAYMIEHINTTVDAIIDEMFQLETYLYGPNGRMRARVQTIFKMIQHCSAQQLTYLLRTCPSHVTLHASRRLDAAIANTIHRIMDCVPLLPPHDSIAMRAVLNRFFLPVPDLLETRRRSVDHLTICIEDTDSLARHIMEQKRGASAGITGHSNDHYQDILRAHPEAITSIMSLCNLIAIGSLADGPARKLLLSGKGTALHKSPTGIRPIVTLVPCGQYTSHAIATEYKAQIQEICGDKQFMGVLHGCEMFLI